MKHEHTSRRAGDQELRAEFDLLADEYHDQHAANIAITGEQPEYFSEYKIADLAMLVRSTRAPDAKILDFGCGIGNSVPHFRKYFRDSELICTDVSVRSMEIAQKRFPGSEKYVQIDGEIPLPASSQNIVFSACVFHHIPHQDHPHWLAELRRVTKPGGLLVIYEHNPLNPLTVHAVNTCPLDVNARLIRASVLRDRASAAEWLDPRADYRVFFPSLLKVLRPTEQYLGWLWFGAQYRLSARRPK